MSKPFAFENNFHAVFVPTIADTATPTDAEITAGVPLTPSLLGDGVSFNRTNNNTSTQMLDGWTKSSIGSRGLTIDLTFIIDFDDTDDIWGNFDEDGLAGHLLVSRRGTPLVDDVVEVYTGTFGKRQGAGSAVDTDQTFTVAMAVGERPVDDAVVTAAV